MKNRETYAIIVIFCLVGLSILPIVSTEQINPKESQTIDINGLIGHWGFNNGDGRDESGNEYDGNSIGVSYIEGIHGLGAEIQGTDRISSISSNFDNSISNQMTISAWIYPYNEYDQRAYIFDCREYGAVGGGFILYITEDNLIRLQIIETGDDQIVDSETTVPIQKWSHVVAIFNHNSEEIKLYINSIENNLSTTYKSYKHSTQDACIGNNHWADGNWQPFDGIIDEVRFYNKALSTDDINKLYENPGLVNYPPETPTIEGETSGKNGVSYIYEATTTDPEEDDVYYWFDWSDGTNTGWVGPFASGESCSESHIWEAEGSYVIKVKAKDSGGEISNWKSLEISMPKNKFLKSLLPNFVLDFIFQLKNRLESIESTLKTGLVGYWSFDENDGNIAYDYSGNYNDGVINGATWANGISNSALYFDGENDGVVINDHPALKGFNEMTISVWAKPTDHESGRFGFVFNKWVPHQSIQSSYYMFANDGIWKAAITDGSSIKYVVNGTNLDDNAWHHLVLWWDGQTVKLIINGDTVDSRPANIDMYDNNAELKIGERLGEAYFNGIIDEMRIYNRALSDDEITNLYENNMKFSPVILMGKIHNPTDVGNAIILEAEQLRMITLSPFQFIQLINNEKIIILNDYIGILNLDFICAYCKTYT